MDQLNLPKYIIKTRVVNNQSQVFDIIRKKYVALLPEEWVRQNFIHYLVEELRYPKGLMAVEHPITINGVNHRVDIVVFNSKGAPLVIVECKSPDVQVDEKVIQQVSRYNILLRAPFLILTNGLSHYCVRINYSSAVTEKLDKIPQYNDLNL